MALLFWYSVYLFRVVFAVYPWVFILNYIPAWFVILYGRLRYRGEMWKSFRKNMLEDMWQRIQEKDLPPFPLKE
jgi:hypothetical protein